MKFLIVICFVLAATALAVQSGSSDVKAVVGGAKIDFIKKILRAIGHVIEEIVPPFLKPKPVPEDPDVFRSPVEVITSKGYPVEVHEVVTEDGYILTAWRMRKNVTKKYPALLQHGLLDCSFSWVVNEPDQSLPYILVDQGYDVWLTNNRGNKYSRGHINETMLSSYDLYWGFSWDEMAKYDLPANLNFVLNTTGASKVHYIGHSQGTTQWFAHISENSDNRSLFQSFTGLGPVMYVHYVTGFFSHNIIMRLAFDLLNKIDIQELMALDEEDDALLGDVCSYAPSLCENILRVICGYTQNKNYNESRIPVLSSHEPGGTSLRTLNHWIQMVGNQNFAHYDFGTHKNLQVYGQKTPPVYPVDNLKHLELPVLLVLGGNDVLSDPSDCDTLINHLPNADVDSFTIEEYGHLDYLWAMDAQTKVHPRVVQFLEKSDSQ